jgi:hypothetical protein
MLSALGTKFDNLANQTWQNHLKHDDNDDATPSQNQQNQSLNQSGQMIPFQYGESWQ